MHEIMPNRLFYVLEISHDENYFVFYDNCTRCKAYFCIRIGFHTHARFFTLFVHLCISGDGVASEGFWRADRPLQPGHVLSCPATSFHQCQKRPGTTASKIKKKKKKKQNKQNRLEKQVLKREQSQDEVLYSSLHLNSALPVP